MDRAAFPRDKVCAGWLTPEVFDLLELSPGEYRNAGLSLQPLSAFRVGILGGRSRRIEYGTTVSYAIRRCEFDAFLLSRTRARRIERTAALTFRHEHGRWIVNERLSAPMLIGAGGHFCPVARHLRRGPERAHPVIAKEAEFRLSDPDARRLGSAAALFFCRDMGGYAWCVPKGEFLNVGIGHRNHHRFHACFQQFSDMLQLTGVVQNAALLHWRGHAYLTAGAGARPLVSHGVLLLGDAAGLAYPESGEGIRPAIESGLLAARTLVAAAGRVDRDSLEPYALAVTQRHPPVRSLSWWSPRASAATGRALLSIPFCTRHIVLDRWFLRRGLPLK
jgi:flavin-dependent dehydrogenase